MSPLPAKSSELLSKSLPGEDEKRSEPSSVNSFQECALLPHQATYEVKLHPSRDQQGASLQGTMTYELVPYGDEYIVKQSAHIHVGDTGDYTHSTLTSHESNDGLAYGFTANATSDSEFENGDTSSLDASSAPSLSDGEPGGGPAQEKIQCHARITGKGGAGTVVYDAFDEITLPPTTVFPLTHLKMLIEKAKKIVPRSVEMLNAIVFDGSSDVRAAVRIHAIISRVDPKKQIIALKHPPFTSMPVLYQAEMRVYTLDSAEGKDAEPDYKIIQIFSENGVLFKIIVEYGEEKMVSTLTELKLFTEKNPESTLVMPK